MVERRGGGASPIVARVPTSTAVVGCGVIGAAWAARMRLRGAQVRAWDPSPNAPAVADEVFANAVVAWAELGLDVDRAGDLIWCDSIAEAVGDAELVQESAPEVLEVKKSTLAEIDAAAPPTTIVGSSTSGLLCTDMASGLEHPERLLVAHPFNPVYLLPVVELVCGEQTADATIDTAKSIYAGLGMKPLHVKVEIDAHIADRLLEAMWREALWLVNDGVATTEEIDDAIRYGFGLRFAQMGIFETYRIAGGEGGFGHFMRQFGPALKWPWTKLMDTPEMTDELVGRLEAQSDAQSGAYDFRELERLRDRNLTAMMRALEANEWGAGQVIAEMRRE